MQEQMGLPENQNQVIEVSQKIGEHFEAVKREYIKNFGFKDWMGCECPTCRKYLDSQSALEISVCLTPQFLGDIAIAYFCPFCDSAFVWHIKCGIKNITQLMDVFSKENANFVGEYQHVLIRAHRHNVSEAEAREAEKSKEKS